MWWHDWDDRDVLVGIGLAAFLALVLVGLLITSVVTAFVGA